MPDEKSRYEEEETYTKVDKRRIKADAETDQGEPAPEEPAVTRQTQEPTPPPAGTDTAATQAEPPQEGQEPQTLAEVGVYGILRFCVSLLSQQAWIALGVQAIPGHETKENLPEAKVAIDTLAFLAEKLAPDFDESEKRELEGLLANLRVNYVRRAG